MNADRRRAVKMQNRLAAWEIGFDSAAPVSALQSGLLDGNLGPGMKSAVDCLEFFRIHVGVNLCRGDTCMPK